MTQYLVDHQECPFDNAQITADSLIEAQTLVKNWLNSLRLKCRYASSGCDEELTLVQEPSHSTNCQFNMTTPSDTPANSTSTDSILIKLRGFTTVVERLQKENIDLRKKVDELLSEVKHLELLDSRKDVFSQINSKQFKAIVERLNLLELKSKEKAKRRVTRSQKRKRKRQLVADRSTKDDLAPKISTNLTFVSDSSKELMSPMDAIRAFNDMYQNKPLITNEPETSKTPIVEPSQEAKVSNVKEVCSTSDVGSKISLSSVSSSVKSLIETPDTSKALGTKLFNLFTEQDFGRTPPLIHETQAMRVKELDPSSAAYELLQVIDIFKFTVSKNFSQAKIEKLSRTINRLYEVLRKGHKVLFPSIFSDWELMVLATAIMVGPKGIVYYKGPNRQNISNAGFGHFLTDSRIVILSNDSDAAPYDVMFASRLYRDVQYFTLILKPNGFVYNYLTGEKLLTVTAAANPNQDYNGSVNHGSSKIVDEHRNPSKGNVNLSDRILTLEDVGCTKKVVDQKHVQGIEMYVRTGVVTSSIAIQILKQIDFTKFIPNVVYSGEYAEKIARRINNLSITVKRGDKIELPDNLAGPIIAAAILVGPEGQINLKCYKTLKSIIDTGFGHFIESKRIIMGSVSQN